MKFGVKEIGKVECAEIELDGITAIAGYNNTGKSTILKAIYAVLYPNDDISSKILSEKGNSVRHYLNGLNQYFDERGFDYVPFELLDTLSDKIIAVLQRGNDISSFSYDKFHDIFAESVLSYIEVILDERYRVESFTDEFLVPIYEKVKSILERSNNEYERFIFDKAVRSVFRGQINNFKTQKDGEIDIWSEEKSIGVSYFDNKMKSFKRSFFDKNSVFYLTTEHFMDTQSERSLMVSDLKRHLAKSEEDVRSNLSLEAYKKLESNYNSIQNIFLDILHGSISRTRFGAFMFHEDGMDTPIAMGNVASGMKTPLIIKKLIENGSLSEGSILLIDEPETNLHPEWQVKLAEILVLLYKEIGIKILINSHSPYFIRAIEVMMANHGVKMSGKYYLMKEATSNKYVAKDVTETTEEIYKELYNPLEYL